MRILVLRGGALGDFIVTLPALAALRAKWPDACIELIGNATAAALALEGKPLDAAHSQHEARWHALHAGEPLPPPLAAWLGEFDLVLNYWPDPDGRLARHFPLRAGQKLLITGAHPTRAPAAAHYCEPLSALGIYSPPLVHSLRAWRPEGATIAVHPGSGSATKNWPLPRWRALCAQLRAERAVELLIVSGEAEPAGLLADLGPPLRNLSLHALADQLARCRLFLGHDSGVSHLAAACGVPCVLLFGPTDPAIWTPPGEHGRFIRRGTTMAEISAEDVLDAINAALSDQT